MSELRIVPVTVAGLEDLLPLVEGYQRFYGQGDIEPERNRRFFGELLSAPEEGVQHLAYFDGRPVGFSTLYFTRCSVLAVRLATLYDLYVDASARGCGIGRDLLAHAAQVARERGHTRMEWETAMDNHRAQALYDSVGGERSEWVHYALSLSDGP